MYYREFQYSTRNMFACHPESDPRATVVQTSIVCLDKMLIVFRLCTVWNVVAIQAPLTFLTLGTAFMDPDALASRLAYSLALILASVRLPA